MVYLNNCNGLARYRHNRQKSDIRITLVRVQCVNTAILANSEDTVIATPTQQLIKTVCNADALYYMRSIRRE